MGHVICMESGSQDCMGKFEPCPLQFAPRWLAQQSFWQCRAAMERQEGRISSTFRHVVPVSEAGQTDTVLDLKKLRKHHQQLLVDRGALALPADFRSHVPSVPSAMRCSGIQQPDPLPVVRSKRLCMASKIVT